VDNRESEERSKKVNSTFSFGSNGVGTGKTGLIKVDMGEFISGFENDFSLGVFLDRKLRKELFDFGDFSFGHRQVVIIYHKIICNELWLGNEKSG